ncbi:MAG: hypothetical protein E6600_04560 [Anaerocolumna aminovalerica]|uniref:hypothetical protein n=1 Tax=Anaerocolumna aminovalerica TaxID=1527 RepID=UPI00290BC92C|nr:hypothetical protein [Anaerocolumna aminovalerica]MDU6263754.1 hypothetical protein [Anaerocolumna aminovalerica]
MFRYFELVGKRQIAELEIVDDSPATKANETDFKEFFKTDVREISKPEYEKLKKEYSK